MFRGDSVDDVSGEGPVPRDLEERPSVSVLASCVLTILAALAWGSLAVQQSVVWLSLLRDDFLVRAALAGALSLALFVVGFALSSRSRAGSAIALALHVLGLGGLGLALAGAPAFSLVVPLHLIALAAIAAALRHR